MVALKALAAELERQLAHRREAEQSTSQSDAVLQEQLSRLERLQVGRSAPRRCQRLTVGAVDRASGQPNH